MKDFKTITNYIGFESRADDSKNDPRVLMEGSQNVLVVDGKEIVVSPGYIIDGVESGDTSLGGIISSYDWITSTGIERHLRSYDSFLEYRYVDSSGNVSYRKLLDERNSSVFNFTTWWDNTEKIDICVFVNKNNELLEWSGAIGVAGNVTANTITKQYSIVDTSISFENNGVANDTILDSNSNLLKSGLVAGDVIIVSGSTSNDGEYVIDSITENTITLTSNNELVDESAGDDVTIYKKGVGSFGEDRFYNSRDKKFIVNDIEFTYTSDASGYKLTGITPNLLDNGIQAGDIFHQSVKTTNFTSAGSDAELDIIFSNQNQIYVADTRYRSVYISDNENYSDFSFSSPRQPGEGGVLTLDSSPLGFDSYENAVYITARGGEWYQVVFTLSSNLTNEVINVEKINSGPLQGAISQSYISKIKGAVVYVTKEKTLDTLGRLENITTPQSKPVSDPIKRLFRSLTFNSINGSVLYYRNQTYITVPDQDLLLIYDHENAYWQPPQTGPYGRLAIIDGELYCHSSQTPDTFKMFVAGVYTHNGKPYTSRAKFSYRNMGRWFNLKQFDEYATEGIISGNTELSFVIDYDNEGVAGSFSGIINTEKENFLFNAQNFNYLGAYHIGSNPLGTNLLETNSFKKFRKIFTFPKVDQYEYAVTFESSQEDAFWKILAHGPNARISTADNNSIKD